MNTGRPLSELAAELERQQLSKRDFIVPTGKIEVIKSADSGVGMRFNQELGIRGITRHAHTQVAQHTKVPQVYYDRMLAEAPELLAENLNHWFKTNQSPRMLRTLDGKVRAFLSDRYRAIDNYDLGQAALPVLLATPGIEVLSSEVTENRMYIKAVTSRVTREVKVGDTVQAGIVISNGEIGNGSVKVEAFFYRLSCLNGMIGDVSLRKYHVGKKHDEIETAYEVFRTETKEADDRALMMKVQDVVRAALNEERLAAFVARLSSAAETQIAPAPDKVIEVVSRSYQLTEGESNNVLRQLATGNQGAGYTQWGLANSITALASEEKNYDRATELERIGGEIAFMPRVEFTNFVGVAA